MIRRWKYWSVVGKEKECFKTRELSAPRVSETGYTKQLCGGEGAPLNARVLSQTGGLLIYRIHIHDCSAVHGKSRERQAILRQVIFVVVVNEPRGIFKSRMVDVVCVFVEQHRIRDTLNHAFDDLSPLTCCTSLKLYEAEEGNYPVIHYPVRPINNTVLWKWIWHPRTINLMRNAIC